MSPPAPRPRVAVVGHVEWLTHGLGVMPGPGEITYLSEPFDEPAGGGGVAASQVAKLGADCLFFTALGSDRVGWAARAALPAPGLTLVAAEHDRPQTRAVSSVGVSADRGIVVIGPPMSATIDDPLPWDLLSGCDAAYFTGHDAGTLRAARAARVLVVTARRQEALIASGVRPDVLVASVSDVAEAIDLDTLPETPGAVVWTEGGRGGAWRDAEGAEGRWAPAPLPGPPVDSYGCGDSFAAGLTVGLARGLGLQDAVELGARCGAACLVGRGGLGPQLVEA